MNPKFNENQEERSKRLTHHQMLAQDYSEELDEILMDTDPNRRDRGVILIERPVERLIALRDEICKDITELQGVEDYYQIVWLYSQPLIAYDDFIFKYIESALNPIKLDICECAYIINLVLDEEIFTVDDIVLNDICEDNINNIKRWLDIAEMTGFCEKHEVSDAINNKILNVCSKVERETLHEGICQEILYKLLMLAVEYNREDVLEKIQCQNKSEE